VTRGFLTILIALLPMATACQTVTPIMSVEEAKRVTANLGGQAFVPPPRTITDVVEHFNLRSAFTVLPAVPERDPSREQMDPVSWGKNYHRWGREARRAGQFDQALVLLRIAAELIRPGMGVDFGRQPWFDDEGIAILRDIAETEATSGNYRDAIKTFEQTISVVRPGGWWSLRVWLAELYARTGDLVAAGRMLREVERMSYTVNPSWPALRAELDSALVATRATLAQAAGRLDEAEKSWRESIAILDRFFRSPQSAGFTGGWLAEHHDARVSRLAECLLRQGRLLEAEVEARRAIGLRSTRGETSYDHLGPVSLLARIVRAQGRYADSEALARAAMRHYADGGASAASSPSVIAPRLELAASLAGQGRFTEALDEYKAAQQALADDALWERLIIVDPAFLYCLLKAKRPTEAAGALDRAIAEAQRTRGENHSTTAELRGLRAMARAAAADHPRALEDYKTAARILLDRRNERDDEATTEGEQEQRIAAILGGYVTLLTHMMRANQPLGFDGTAEAFRVAGATHIRSVQRALDASAARGGTRNPELAELVRREQDATKQIAALQGLLGVALIAPEADLRARIERLRQARQTLAQQITKEFPAYAQLVNPAPVTVEQARAVLRAREVLITTLVTEEKTYVWAVPKDGPLSFAEVPIGEQGIATLVRRVRASLDSQARTLGAIPPFDVEAAHELYRLLLEPVKSGWGAAETLLVVAHGALGQISFGLLPTERVALEVDRSPYFSRYRAVPWLIRRYAVTTLPSVSALTTLRTSTRSSAERRPFIGFGDPYFSEAHAQEGVSAIATAGAPTRLARGDDMDPRRLPTRFRDVVVSPGVNVISSRLGMLPRLPDTRDEILAMANAMGADLERDVFLGRAANKHTVKTVPLARYRVVAFATHGLVPGDLDGLTQPALALTAPSVANIEGDGLLTMEEILSLRLDADWVVLSACNTANGAGTGSEAISGLGRAFFYAGARALLVTHWPVETRAARTLTTELFRRLTTQSGLTRAGALRATMNWMIDEGTVVDPETKQVIFSFGHPIFWAAFALIGDDE
jgi:CHAT domain-containing protein